MLQSRGCVQLLRIYARSSAPRGASGTRALRRRDHSRARSIRAHIENTLGTIVGFLPRKERGGWGGRDSRRSHQLFESRSRPSWCARNASKRSGAALRAAEKERERVWQFDCKIELGARNNPRIHPFLNADACVQFALKCREKLALHFARWKIERK